MTIQFQTMTWLLIWSLLLVYPVLWRNKKCPGPYIIMSITIYQFCKKFCWHIYLWESSIWAIFFKNHMAWGDIKTHISRNVQNIRTELYTFTTYIMLKFPLSQKLYIKLEGLPWFTYYILTKTLENQLLMTHYKIFPFITECILVGSNISCSSED